MHGRPQSRQQIHGRRTLALAWLAVLLSLTSFAASPAISADLVVPSAAAVRAGLETLPGRFAANTGHKLTFMWSTAGGTRDRVTSGEPFDLAIAPPAVIDQLTKGGFLVAGKGGPLGTTKLGVAVRKGADRPAMVTADDFKAALMKAPSIGLSNPATGATTGVYYAKLLADLGIADALKSKIKLYPDGTATFEALAKGEVAIAAGQVSEMLPVAGVELVGPMPDAIQLRTVYAVGLSAKSSNPEAALKLLDAMSAPETKAALKASGFDVQ